MAKVLVINFCDNTKEYKDIELCRCKLCGRTPAVIIYDEVYTVECLNPDCNVRHSVDSLSKKTSIRAWNEKMKINLKHYEKPPLGIKPSWLHAEERIKELAGAIERYSNHLENEENIKCIRAWAEEIQSQCDIIEFIDKV